MDSCLDGYPNPYKMPYSISLQDCSEKDAIEIYYTCQQIGLKLALCWIVSDNRDAVVNSQILHNSGNYPISVGVTIVGSVFHEYKLMFATELERATAMFVI